MLSKCFSFVHDALYIDVHPAEIFRIITDVKKSMNDYPLETFGMPVVADMVLGYSMGEELELKDMEVIQDDELGLEGYFTMSGFMDEFTKMVDNWKLYYDIVDYEIIDQKDKYIEGAELFVPKKAISRHYWTTRSKIEVKAHIKHVFKSGDKHDLVI